MMRLTSAVSLVLVLGALGCGESSSGNDPGESGAGGSGGSGSSTGGAPSGGSGGMTDPGGKASGGNAQAGSSTTGGGGAAQGGFPGVNLPEGKGWLELPDTELSKVCACNDGFPEVCANSGCGGIFAWSSGAYDSLRSRLIVFGGGHSDYFGNELYALSLSDRAMSRLNDPGLPLADECSSSTANGTQAGSRHTYDALLYVAHADRLWTYGGSMTPCGYLSDDTWTYSFADEKWEPHQPTGPKPKAVPGIVADYDPMSKKIFVHDDSSLYSYDLEQDAFELLLEDDTIDYHMTGVIDPVARKLVVVGAGSVYVYGLDADHEPVTLETTGADELVGSGYPGLAFDEQSGKIVAWNGGDSAFSLDLASGAWTALTSPNGPGDANETGTYKRWRYVPGQSSFVLVNGPSQNAFLFRL
jgi:hypothetical protein